MIGDAVKGNLSTRAMSAVLVAAVVLVLSVFVAAHTGSVSHNLQADDSFHPDSSVNFLNTTPTWGGYIQPYTHSDYGAMDDLFSQEIPVAFRGFDMYMNTSHTGFDSNPPLNITNSSGGEVASTPASGDRTVLATDSENASEDGRYTVWVDGGTSADRRHIDLVSSAYNVTGRFFVANPGSLTNPKVELRYWENLSKINVSGRDDINLTNETWASGYAGGDEHIYRINTTTLDKFWIGATADGYGWTHNPSRGVSASMGQQQIPPVPSPRINDIRGLRQAETVSGQLKQADGTIMDGVEVRLTGVCVSPRCWTRQPRMSAPPVMTNITNSTGHFTFNGLDPGIQNQLSMKYAVEVVNESVALSGHSEMMPDMMLDGPGTGGDQGTFNVTNRTGHINGTIEGDNADNWVVAAFGGGMDDMMSSSVYMEVQDNVSNVSLRSVPEGTYSVVAARFAGEQPAETAAKSATVTFNETTELHFTFPETVNITGNVTDDATGEPLADMTVTAENRSNFKFYSAQTAADGSYTLQVENDTAYDVTVRPPHDSTYVDNTTNVDVSGETEQNITLGEGTWLAGNVTANGKPVRADVAIWREGPQGGTFQHGRTDSTGLYNLSGLESGKTYNFDVYPHEPGVGENHSDFQLQAGQTWRNVSLNSASANLSGFVTNGSNTALNATVTLVNREDGSQTSVDTNNSGGYEFTDQPLQFYTLRVMPDNGSYAPDDASFSLRTDMQRNFTLDRKSGLEGYVKDGSGGVSNADVFAYNRTTREYDFTRTNGTGYYHLDLKAGGYNVEAGSSDHPPNRTTVDVSGGGTTSQDIILAGGNTLSGHITENSLSTGYSGRIGIWNHSEDAYGFSEITNGEFSMKGLKNVTYNVWFDIDADGYSPERKTMAFPGDGKKNFSVGSNLGQKLNITVTGNGEPLENATVRTPYREKTTDASGFVTFPNQTIGDTVTVSITAEEHQDADYKGTRREYDIGSPGDMGTPDYVTDTVSLEEITEISVDVNVTKNKEDVEGASIVFTSNESDVAMLSGSSTNEGITTVDGLSEGDYLVSLGVSGDSGDTVVQDSVNLNMSEGFHINTSLGGSSYDLWYNANR